MILLLCSCLLLKTRIQRRRVENKNGNNKHKWWLDLCTNDSDNTLFSTSNLYHLTNIRKNRIQGGRNELLLGLHTRRNVGLLTPHIQISIGYTYLFSERNEYTMNSSKVIVTTHNINNTTRFKHRLHIRLPMRYISWRNIIEIIVNKRYYSYPTKWACHPRSNTHHIHCQWQSS